MSDLNERIDEPDSAELADPELAEAEAEVELEGSGLSDSELDASGLTDEGLDQDVDLDDTESIDAVKDEEAEQINPIFGDDQEVIADNLNYDE